MANATMIKAVNTSQTDQQTPASTDISDFDAITEGKATVLFTRGHVFYNNVQQFNRDMSIHAIKLFAELYTAEYNTKQATTVAKHNKSPHNADNQHTVQPFTGLRIVEAFAASGLRSIRYALEMPDSAIRWIVVNDMDRTAIDAIQRNIMHNNLTDGKKLIAVHNDCNSTLFEYKYNMISKVDNRVECIDLDPYGSASEYLDAAVNSILDGGLLCVTCTDKAVLCGNNSETCYAKYGSVSIRMAAHAELALRVLLNCIDTIAARYKRYIVPVLSLSVDFYVRVFVRVQTSAATVKYTASKQSMLFVCSGCHQFSMQAMHRVKHEGNSLKFQNAHLSIPVTSNSKCDQCCHTVLMAGPVYNAPIHDAEFVNTALERARAEPTLYGTSQRMIATLGVIATELHDVPLYYTLPSICHAFKLGVPKVSLIRSAIINAGYRVSAAHCCADALKTNCPNAVIYDIMRNYTQHINHPTNFADDDKSIFATLLRSPPTHTSDFTLVAGTEQSSKVTGVPKFLPNPEQFFGPKSVASKRAHNSADLAHELKDRQQHNQGKRQKKRKACIRFQTNECKWTAEECRYAHRLIDNKDGSHDVGVSDTAADGDVDTEKESTVGE